MQRATQRLKGAYAIAVFCRDEPQRVVGARDGSPREKFTDIDAMIAALKG